jgi:RNA polymerase sigma factor (sigma-70 family)
VQILSRTITARESTPSTIAFETAAMPHYAGLVRRLTLVLGSTEDAQDVAQEAYFRGFRSWSRFDGTDVRAWLYTIALRLAFNHLRSRRRGLSAWRRAEPKTWPDPADPDLAAALARLDPRSRSAFLLTIVDGYTQAEAAAILGVPVGTLSSWLTRDRERLRQALHP